MEKKVYHTLEEHVHYEIDKIKGSRFIGHAIPVQTETEAKEALHQIKKQYHDARHHCHAYILGVNKENYNYSDDGEPSKTAGLPIYTVLNGSGITNVLVVVIRYFGGTKLGTGGLVKAYTQGAQAVLNEVNIITKELQEEVLVRFDYNSMKQIYHIMNKYEGRVVKEVYESDIQFSISLNQAFVSDFKKDLIEFTDGRASLLS